MKKILALVLALVMTMSLATISSGAAFSDADKVQYTEAVNALTAYGVLGGYADGTIRPQADVTRGAAAKMVAMVATGSNATTIGYYKGTTTFSDVPATHTFADAVAFCVARGIVAGYGDGTYGVGDNVKGWAVAKMALVAMGYDAKAFGMEGAGSALNTITLASQKHLFDGMAADFDATAAASREECAQIVYNAMKQTTVVKGFVNSDGSYTYSDSSAKLADNYSAIATGIVVENGANKAGATTTKLDDNTVLATATGLDLIGHKVQYVDSKAYSKDGVVPFAVVDLSYEVVVADGTKTLDKAAFTALFGAETVTAAASVVEIADYAVAATAYTAAPAYGADVLDGTYVFDEAGKLVAYKAPATFEVGYVSTYTAGTAKADGSLDITGDTNAAWTLYTKNEGTTKVSFYDGIALNDVVAVQHTGDMFTVTKLETVSGVVSQMNTKAGEKSVTIGGKVYAESDKYASATLGFSNLSTSWLGADVTLYLDINGAYVGVIATPGAAAATSLVYVVDSYSVAVAGTTNAYGETTGAYTAYYAQAVDMTGKEISLPVKALADVKLGIQVATAKYDSTDKMDYYEFNATPAATDNWVIAANAAADEATALKIADNYYYASDVKFFYVDAGEAGTVADLKVEVKSGVQAAPAGAAYYAVKVGETANYNVQYVFVTGAYSAGNVKSDDIVYVAATGASTDKKAYTKADGSIGTSFVQTVYINGELKTVDSVDETLTAGFCGYEINEYGLYDFVALPAGAPVVEGAVANLYGTKLSAAGLTDKEAKDAKIVDVVYALDAGATADLEEVTTLEALAGKYVAVVYNVDAAGNATSFATIYVIPAPVVE